MGFDSIVVPFSPTAVNDKILAILSLLLLFFLFLLLLFLLQYPQVDKTKLRNKGKKKNMCNIPGDRGDMCLDWRRNIFLSALKTGFNFECDAEVHWGNASLPFWYLRSRVRMGVCVCMYVCMCVCVCVREGGYKGRLNFGWRSILCRQQLLTKCFPRQCTSMW